MELQPNPDLLTELLQDVVPADDSLVRIWSQIGNTETLMMEEERLRERFLELAGKVISISQVMEKRQ